MILDSSAILAVIFEEEGHERVVDTIGDAKVVGVGAPTLFETTMVATARFGLHGRALVAQFMERWSVVVTAFDERHSLLALDAFVRYGKGRHPARLNFGDCMTYATSRLSGMPVLFTGNDFSQTDVAVA